MVQFTTPGGTTLLQPNIFITVLGIASTVSYQAKHVSNLLPWTWITLKNMQFC